MVFLNSILFILLAALIASTYNYYKEKRLLKEFIRHSRRHRYHQDMDVVRRQKANRYLTLSIILFCIALPLLLENFIQAFIEDNWKWILPVISLSIFLRLYKNYIVNRNNRVAKSLLMSFENANNS
ncbi:MAG: hypothetical protein ACXVBZ_05615 [Flavisolibacter sp.]